ncbi:transcription factor bHLH162-like [Aristolochia californica]|uniref:transcription factor bHLH162-like n=1 Tax=Aristolochia californica TaxID=171875 RepID=UPI0035D7A603
MAFKKAIRYKRGFLGFESNPSCTSKSDRKVVEKTRRLHMKNLCLKLASLVPTQSSRFRRRLVSVEGKEISDTVLQVNHSRRDLFEQATVYVENLQKRIEELKTKRDLAVRNNDSSCRMVTDSTLPVVEVREADSILEVVLVNELHSNFILSEVVRVLEEEGAEIVHAHSTLASDKIFIAIHAQATDSRLGLESATVHRKLKLLLQPRTLLDQDFKI